jgi:lactoylglutathione lyase
VAEQLGITERRVGARIAGTSARRPPDDTSQQQAMATEIRRYAGDEVQESEQCYARSASMAAMTQAEPTVTEMRLVVTTDDYDDALGFYRDVLGLPQIAVFDSPAGRVTLLGAGRATLELTDTANAGYVDAVEVGRRVAGPIRVAFAVSDTDVMTRRLAATGATVLAAPTRTPWGTLNARLEAPAGLQLTLFSGESDIEE